MNSFFDAIYQGFQFFLNAGSLVMLPVINDKLYMSF